ncbi:dTDP-4-amino-4,6-dideoxygalactose transaminase [Candidatus Electrothrix aarhusensis]
MLSSRRIFLSAPHMGEKELDFIHEAFASNYIAPVGPQIEAFEQEFAETVGAKYAVAVSSGTAALHLLLRYAGVGSGDLVFCSTFTFVGSANPILYQGGRPIFIDSDYSSWNMDPALLVSALDRHAAQKCLPKAVILVHLYGQPADIDPIQVACNKHGVFLIEDAAEALGAEYKGKSPGTFGLAGFFSFNGNKIITTSGGGMIVSDDETLIKKVKFWATQAKDNASYYQHSEMGYNYRMSNVLAAIGRGQLRVLSDRVQKKREIFERYYEKLSSLPGISFMPEPGFAHSTRWLTCLTVDPIKAGVDRDTVLNELEKNNIEARPTWKPMHMQPLFRRYGGHRTVAERLFANGICLPSGTNMNEEDIKRVVKVIYSCWGT